jgi:hypothetical protein
MGDRVQTGNVIYNVLETAWKPSLGDSGSPRVPRHRFLLLKLSITNGGGKDANIPLLSLEDANGQSYSEEVKGDHVDGWLGLLRIIHPAQTEQGTLLFDVPPGAYTLVVSDGGEPDTEKIAKVEIPLRMDEDPALSSSPATAGPR